jgi:hypothetical protein
MSEETWSGRGGCYHVVWRRSGLEQRPALRGLRRSPARKRASLPAGDGATNFRSLAPF